MMHHLETPAKLQHPQPHFKVGDRVYSIVHCETGVILDFRRKAADRQWRGEWEYKLDIAPDLWLYQTTLHPVSVMERSR